MIGYYYYNKRERLHGSLLCGGLLSSSFIDSTRDRVLVVVLQGARAKISYNGTSRQESTGTSSNRTCRMRDVLTLFCACVQSVPVPTCGLECMDTDDPSASFHCVQTKKRPTLAKRFKCPFCANEDVVECKMNFRQGTGSLACRLCGATYQMPIHHLHEPVDVFSEWLDDCEAAERANSGNGNGNQNQNHPEESHDNHNHNNNNNNGPSHHHDVESDDDSDHETDHIPASSGLSSRPKPTVPPKTTKSKQPAAASAAPAQTYASLGLDDSDDDDSE
eukprot:scaffold91721_cov36-Attheya_sp.AAC.1